jgi:selenium metabolism protein YedF
MSNLCKENNMVKTIDARKLECPKPVILTSEALKDSPLELMIIVDNDVARQNVTRLAESSGCVVSMNLKEDGIYLELNREKEVPVVKEAKSLASTVIFIGSNIIGRGENEELGGLLMHSFLNTIGGLVSRPESIIFMNSGVRLVVEDSPVLGELKQIEEEGVELLACGTCLSRLGLSDKVAIGQVSNMYTLASTLLEANKVISL